MSDAPEKKKPSRFRWFVILIVAAVVGILVAVAMASYGDYAHRAQASEAVALLGAAKTPLAEYFASQKAWPKSLEEVLGSTHGKYTRSLAITRAAAAVGALELTATMKTEGVDRRVRGAKIRMFTADGGKTWTCRGEPERQAILPLACRD